MVVDVSSILKESGGRIEISGEIPAPGEEFSGVRFTEPIRISGSITNNGKTLKLSAHADCRASTECARCLKEIEIVFDFDFSEFLAQGEEQIDDEVYMFEHDSVDLTGIVIDNLSMNISGKYLCGEDCKGLCPKCGADLNETECGCDTETIDPRWAALADIMKGSSDASD
ncbi:MAG: DUF177 domain-containing protein [Oscillospiraceae bacterium]|nr:DUF177 domain-containing protein [Oscillospiraceae bacterium]